jgi:hypothetical protein
VQIDQQRLRRRTAAFLKSPQSKHVWAELETPVWAGLLLSGATLLYGLVLLVSVRWSLRGCSMIYSALTLEAVRGCRSKARQDPTLLAPLICHGVITNPQVNVGAVLGSLDESADHRQLARFAVRLGGIYQGTAAGSAPPEISAMLRDDQYQPYRRRLIPESFCQVPECYLFDVTLQPDDGAMSDGGSVMYAFVVTRDDQPLIEQIPWSVAAPCIESVD